LPVYKAKAKASDSYIVLLTGKPDQTRFIIIEVELIGKSQWCCSAKWGSLLHVLTN